MSDIGKGVLVTKNRGTKLRGSKGRGTKKKKRVKSQRHWVYRGTRRAFEAPGAR